jgi:dihydrodipicolinate synthase/N-acetylneuraminate lyase
MSPHSDAPSPTGSYTRRSHNLPIRPATNSTFRTAASVYSDSEAHYSSSFESTSTASSLDIEEHPSRPLVPGVYVPTLCFFEPETEDLDLETIATHAVRLAKAGVAGIATQGSNGEAVHLSHSERQQVTSTTRKALRDAGYNQLPIIVGCGAQSTREAIQLCKEAYRSGGDYALVLPPSYYAPLFAPSSKSILKFFNDVADASPIPLIIYNYPGAVSGIDLNSDIIIELSRHPNIVGVKLTCGNTGKLNRIVAATRPAKPSASNVPSFLVLGGSADFTLQSLVGGGHGILAGLANISPKACIKTIELFNAGYLAEAQAMQEVVARGDWAAIQGGIVGTKAGMQGCFGYGGVARSPLPQPSKEETQRWTNAFKELVTLEKSL